MMASKCRRILALRSKEEGSFREARSRARNRRMFSNRSLSLSSRVERPEHETIYEESPLAGKRSRSLASLVKSSRRSVHSLVKLFETMTEGRKTQITLLDDQRLDITIQPKLYAKELLDLVASHLNLKEKEYFGIYYVDEKGHTFWLQHEKKVLDHDFPRRSQLLLHLGIKFYVETIAQLRDKPAIELFYFNAKQSIYKGHIECDSETVFELAAHVLQITYGNFTTADTARDDLKKLCVVPTRTLQEHPSLGYCEERVLFHYQKLEGSTRGLAIVNYMTICESLPTYGNHYYEVKDKKDIPWWLGISHKGIAVYDKTDKQTPRKIFHWKQLENLYYRDKKFSVEVHDPKRRNSLVSQVRVSVSRRTFGPGNVNVHAWFSSSPHLTKCIWLMAVAQHQFCLERRDNKTYLHPVRSMSEIAAELSHSSTSLSAGSGASDLSRSTSSHSLPSLSTSRYDVNIDPEKVKKEMYQALKERQEALKEALKKKNEEFKQLCIQEGELIGHLPKDTPLAPGEQPPIIRRRVTTAFTLTSKLIPRYGEDMEDQLARLDLEYELQGKITSAAYKLAHDRSVSKQVRKQRKQVYHKSQTKLKDMEKKLNDMKKKAGHSSLKPCPVYEESELVSPSPSPIPRPKKDYSQTAYTNNMEVIHDDPTYDPAVTDRDERTTSPLPPGSPSSHLSPSHSSPQLKGGYTQSSVYSTGTQYRNQRYPTFSSRTGPPPPPVGGGGGGGGGEYLASSKFDGSHDSGFSSANNMTQLPANQRGSQYENGDEVKTPTNHQYENLETEFEHQMKLNLHQQQHQQHQHADNSYYGEEEPATNVYSTRGVGSSNNVQHLLHLTPSKYGSQREPNVEHVDIQDDGLVTPRNSTVDAEPVYSYSSSNYEPPHVQWGETQITEPSPIIYSPHKSFEDLENRPNTPSTEHSYSPRVYEYQSPSREVQVIHLTGNQMVSEQCPEMDQTPPQPTSPIPPHSRIVTTITKIKPQIEVSKPFETSDFFKYSEKLRRARMLENYQRQLIGEERLSNLAKLNQQTDTSSVNSFYSSSYTSEHSGPSSPAFYPRMQQQQQQVTPSSPYMAYHVPQQVQHPHHQSSMPTTPQPQPQQPQIQQQQQQQPQSAPSSPFPQYWRDFEQPTGTPFPVQRSGTPVLSGGGGGGGGGMSSISSRTVTSSSYHHSVSSSSSSSSHIQYSSAQSVSRVFRSHQMQTSRHAQYQPPQPMACEPVAVRDMPSPGSTPGTGSPANLSNITSSHRSGPSEGGRLKSRDNSFSFETGESLADAFSEEMLAWYEDQDAIKKHPTFV